MEEEGSTFLSFGVLDEGFYSHTVALARIFRVFPMRVKFHESLVLLRDSRLSYSLAQGC